MIIFSRGLHWSTSGGVFDWILEHVAEHTDDNALNDLLRVVVDNNLGDLEFAELSPEQRRSFTQIVTALLPGDVRDEFSGGPHEEPMKREIRTLSDVLSTLTDEDVQPLS
jgi:hypothetical protein